MASEKSTGMKFQKSYFNVLGICCTSEVPLIEKILKPLEGIEKVSVIVPTRTVIVVHDNLLISQIQIVKALNDARLEANIRVFGEDKTRKMWPSPYTLASGVLLALSFFKFLCQPLHWLALGATVVGLPPILIRSVAALRRLTLDINILMLIAVCGAIAMKDYTEAASIVFLFTIAEWLESRASYKATAVMTMLMNMSPQKAVVEENGQVVDARDVKVNTIIAVKAGEVIPIDGIIIQGKSEVDERTLTGESFPVAKQIQSSVWAGTMNLNGYISVKTTALAEDSAVARMAKLVEEAQHSKSKTQRFIDEIAKYYTPAVVVISAGIAVVPTILKVHDVKQWYHLALVLLVTACPCALILSTPIATFCALTKAATMGLLIKGGDYLEALAKIKIIAFDKTGTITRGEFTVLNFRSVCSDISIDMLLHWVSSIEAKSSHPMAAALVEYGHSNGVEPKPESVKEFQIFPGEGLYGELIDGKNIYIGNKRIASRAGCQTVPSLEEAKEGVTVGYVLEGATPIGIFSMSDTCRSGVVEAISQLKSLGLKTAMLTGDSRGAAMHVQHQLGHASMGRVHAELLPEEKVKIMKELKKEGSTAMVGDGMNDAPALATADVGISMGIAGSAVAIETGHVTLMSNDIRNIPQAILLSRLTRRKIVENVALSIATKLAILALAFSGHPLLWAAVLADVGTCLLVIFNSMFILRGTDTARAAPKSSHHKHGCCGSSARADNGPKDTCAGSAHCHSTPHVHGQNKCSHVGKPGTCGGSLNSRANDSVTCCSTTFTASAHGDGCKSNHVKHENMCATDVSTCEHKPNTHKCCSVEERHDTNHVKHGNTCAIDVGTCEHKAKAHRCCSVEEERHDTNHEKHGNKCATDVGTCEHKANVRKCCSTEEERHDTNHEKHGNTCATDVGTCEHKDNVRRFCSNEERDDTNHEKHGNTCATDVRTCEPKANAHRCCSIEENRHDTCGKRDDLKGPSSPCRSHACLGFDARVKPAGHEHSITVVCETDHPKAQSDPHTLDKEIDPSRCLHVGNGVHVHGTCEEHASGIDSMCVAHVCFDMEKRESSGCSGCCKGREHRTFITNYSRLERGGAKTRGILVDGDIE